MHAFGVYLVQDAQAGVDQRGSGRGITGIEQQQHIVAGKMVRPLGVEGIHHGGEVFFSLAGEDSVRGVIALKVFQVGQQFAEVGLELLQRLEIQSINRWHAVAHLFLGDLRFLGAFVAEGCAGDDAHVGELVGQNRQVDGRNTYEGDEHDGRDGGHENEERDHAAGF